MVVAIAAAAMTGGALYAAYGPWIAGAGAGFVGGAISTGTLKGALKGALVGAISGGFASEIAGADLSGFGDFSEIARDVFHGMSQGLISEAAGGEFKSGFIGGFLGHMAGRYSQKFIKGDTAIQIAKRTAVASVVGGTVAKIGGGKFANGAVSAAFAHLFSEASRPSNFSSSPATARARALKGASEFTIGDKDFVIEGGTLAEKLQVQADLKAIFSTPRGAVMLSQLESRRSFFFFSKDFVIDLNVVSNAYAYPGGDAIYVDPTFHPTIQSTAGPIAATTQRIMAHELGHAVFGTLDDGPARMNNVLMNENPIMSALGGPSRTRY
jgi:hypothetical protein